MENIEQLNSFTWAFKTDNPYALKRSLMEIALSKNLNIVNWESTNSNTLEDIFRSLTNAAS